MHEKPAVAVLLSGAGSNLQAIAEYASASGAFGIAGVLSDRADAGGLTRAANMRCPTRTCERRDGETRSQHEGEVLQALMQWAPDLIVLAGYMRVLSDALVNRFEGRMLNVHPSLLPRYRGLDTYRRALADGAARHGATVHYVSEQLDGGPLIAQAAVDIVRGDDEHSLRGKVQALEHRLYPRTIHAACRGDVRLADGCVQWRGRALPAPLSLEQLEEAYP